jgi:hypothetical protein
LETKDESQHIPKIGGILLTNHLLVQILKTTLMGFAKAVEARKSEALTHPTVPRPQLLPEREAGPMGLSWFLLSLQISVIKTLPST